METTSSIQDAFQQGDWATSLDMTEAFFQQSQGFHELELYTDASNFGWGCHVDTLSASEKWPLLQSNWHINRLEVEAVALSGSSSHSSEAKQSAFSRTPLQ